MEKDLGRDKVLGRYSLEVRKQAIENVLVLVSNSFDEALRADGLNITGSVLKTVSRATRKKRDEIKKDDSDWSDVEKKKVGKG